MEGENFGRRNMPRLKPNALLVPNATGFVQSGCQGNRFLCGGETGEPLSGISPGKENREGLLLLERVDL